MVDREAFARLLTSHQRAIYTFIRSLVPNPADVDEVWQNTNVILLKKADQFESGTNFRAWSLQVAQWEVFNFRRRQQTRNRVLSDVMVEQLADDIREQSESEQSRLEALRHCVSKLRPNDRELIQLRYREQARGAEMADRLGRSKDAVYRAVTRIRRALLACIRFRMAGEEHP
jgi:RNA polymerase sigma-70 factor (ECF subfamily)